MFYRDEKLPGLGMRLGNSLKPRFSASPGKRNKNKTKGSGRSGGGGGVQEHPHA
jgi:hypothetical protein